MMENAIQVQLDRGAGLEARKRELTTQRLEICRDAIKEIDPASKESWSQIINELLEGGFEASDLEVELAASSNTIYKWRTGVAAPREMTRRLLHRAILEMVEVRLARELAPLEI
jgi:hypothetical protein